MQTAPAVSTSCSFKYAPMQRKLGKEDRNPYIRVESGSWILRSKAPIRYSYTVLP